MTEARWAALIVDLPRALEDEAAGILGAGSLGVESTAIDGERARLTIYVSGAAMAEALARTSRERQAAWGIPAAAWQQSVVAVEDQQWATRYQASLRPFPIGTRFVVVPGEPASDAGGREALVLVPGMAFGTGEHPTTRLCVDALERCVLPGSRWLDLGCGSAILALVLARCGAGSVLARDNDPEAVEVAQDVVAANNAQSKITVETGSAEDLGGCGFDGVVANIAAEYFDAAARLLTEAVRPGGLVVVSGFLAEDRARLERALNAAGLTVVEFSEAAGWGLWLALRPPAGG